MRLSYFYFLYFQINRHKYARLRAMLDFMTELKDVKPKKINCYTFLELSFEFKIFDKNAHAYSWRHFEYKMKIIFSRHQMAQES